MTNWMKPKLTDYWDERVAAIDRGARELAALDDVDAAIASREIAAAVRRHVEVFEAGVLAQAAVAITDDLYKAGSAITRWDQHLETYLRASAGTFFAALSQRGLTIQYLVDNAWEDMTRPVQLFPAWFGACGFVYACPQVTMLDLVEADPQPAGSDPAAMADRYINEARDVTDRLVERCQSEARHLFQLDTDYTEHSFAAAFERQGSPGTVTIFRNEAPEPGTTVSVWYPIAGQT